VATDKQRREAQRRHLQRQLQKRQEQAVKRRRYNLIGSIIGALIVVALVVFFIVQTTGDDKTPAAARSTAASTSAAPTSTPASSASATEAAYPCDWKATGSSAKKGTTKPPTTTPTKTGTVTVSVTTNRGPLTFTLDRSKAPCAVESFVSLTEQKYFDATTCHRLTTSGIYVVQCGDPTGSGSGGPGYSFADELTGKETYTRGVLAMANSGADTNGSQFFIVYKDSTLGPQYTVFGSVTKGLGVIDKVAAGGSDNSHGTGDGKPKLALNLTRLTTAAKA
jgi:peptidyl-prolyl cis-trans isomerase B (cyclophilin B)